MTDPSFQNQYELSQQDYLSKIDFFTWTRHFHVIKDLCGLTQGDVLEVGTGDGVVKRCCQPTMRSYTVLDINAKLLPDVLGDLRELQTPLLERYDVALAAEVLEHLPFEALPVCIGHLYAYLRPGGRLLLTLPHRKGHMLVVTPRQRLWKWRFPVGMTSLSEAWNRFVRGKIWIDPHHCWEIGDGQITRADVEQVLRAQGFSIEQLMPLPYCDYWMLQKRVG